MSVAYRFTEKRSELSPITGFVPAHFCLVSNPALPPESLGQIGSRAERRELHPVCGSDQGPESGGVAQSQGRSARDRGRALPKT